MRSRYHHLLDGKRTGALFELEQDDMRGIRHDGRMRPENGLCKRVSHGAREEHQADTEHQQQHQARRLVWYYHGRWVAVAQPEARKDMQTRVVEMCKSKESAARYDRPDDDRREFPWCGRPKARCTLHWTSAMPVPRHSAAQSVAGSTEVKDGVCVGPSAPVLGRFPAYSAVTYLIASIHTTPTSHDAKHVPSSYRAFPRNMLNTAT